MIDFSLFLKELEQYSDKFYITPIKEEEIDAVEKRLQIIFPKYFREFLRHIGLRQDLVHGLYDSLDSIVEVFEELPKEITEIYIPIGDDGGEEVLMLKKQPNDYKAYHFEYGFYNSGEIVEWHTDFKEMLLQNSERIKKEYVDLTYNSQKEWAVQFSIDTNDEDLIYKTLNAKLLEKWSEPEITSANVYSYKSKILYEGVIYSFGKSEYKDWKTPIYAFTINIPFLEIKDDNIITKTEEKIKAAFEAYGKADYGILSFGDEE